VTLIDEIEDVRRSNNHLWMDILRIAMKYAPEKTKRTLLKINLNDQRISSLLKKVAED